MKKLLVLTILLGFAQLFSACSKSKETYMTESGVKYEDLVVGKGNECKMGTTVDCHYTLWFADSTGKKITRFQSSKDAPGAKPFQCTIGQNLIQGWSDGMVGMKEGGTRQLTIPPHLGYGEKGYGPIAGNQWLVFEIEYVKFIK